MSWRDGATAIGLAALLVAVPTWAIAGFARGDANCDGQVDAADVPVLLNAFFTGSACSATDVNGDGLLSGADVLALTILLSAQGEDTPTTTPTAAPTFTVTPTPAPGPRIVFFGLAAADGQQLFPATTTAEGIPVYQRPSGLGFKLVIEASPGPDGRPVGARVFVRDGRPDLQIQSTLPLGDGSRQVCVSGVPAIDPPSFGPGATVDDVLNDLACNFVAAVNPVSSCTLDEFQRNNFLSLETRVQFCVFVDSVLALPQGEAFFTVQLANVAGVIGERRQIVVRAGLPPLPTATHTLAATETRTPTDTRALTATPTLTRTRTPTSSATRTATASRTATVTITRTFTLTPTGSRPPTQTFTSTATITSTRSRTATATRTASASVTATATRTRTPVATITGTRPSTATFTGTPSATRTASVTVSPGRTATPTAAPTFTGTLPASSTLTYTRTPTPTRTFSRTVTPTITLSPTVSRTVTRTPTPTRTITGSRPPTPTETPSPSVTPSFTRTRTATRTATATATPSPPPTETGTRLPSRTPTRTPPASSTATATDRATASRTPTISRTPTLTVTGTLPATGTPTRTGSPTRTTTGTATISRTPTRTWTGSPVATATNTRTPTRTPLPSASVTSTATITSSRTPTVTATVSRSATPTLSPTITRTPTTAPTATDTRTPTITRTPSATRTRTRTGTNTATPTSTRTRTNTRTPTPTSVPGPLVTFFGVANANGTLSQPIGMQGSIPVYERPLGFGFILIVEGRRGGDNLSVGNSSFNHDPGNADTRPDLQIIASRPLGDGSAAVCDNMPPDFGGVPAVSPPSFDVTQTISNAINDLGCRFIDGSGNPGGRQAASACVLYPDGEYRFANSQSQIQFCATVSRPMLFPKGDTLLTVRLRNTGGQAGGTRQIIVRSES